MTSTPTARDDLIHRLTVDAGLSPHWANRQVDAFARELANGTRVAALREAADIADEVVPPDLPRSDRDQGRVDVAADIRRWADHIEQEEPAVAAPPPATRADDAERRAQYTAVIRRWWDADDGGAEEIADAVMAVADTEQTALRAENANLRTMYEAASAREHELIDERDEAQAQANFDALADLLPEPATAPVDPAHLRDHIAEALIRWTYRGQAPDPETGILDTVRANAYSRADAVLAVLPPATSQADEFDEMENARRSFPNGVKPALCKALAAADGRNIGRIPGEDRERYAKQADAALRLMGWRENQLVWQHQSVLKKLRAAEEATPATQPAVLREAAQHLYTALFPAVYADMGQKAAEGVNRAVSELRRMADEERQDDTEADEDPARIDRLRPEFFEHASVESIDFQIQRARRQQCDWGNRERTLAILREARVMQKEHGEWPAAGARQDGAPQCL